MRKAKETEQKEVGKIKLSDTRELVASLVDSEKGGTSSQRATRQTNISHTQDIAHFQSSRD